MIIYANSRAIATDTEGDTQSIGVTGPEQDEIKVSDHEQENILSKILKELKKNNLHMSILTDTYIRDSDMEE